MNESELMAIADRAGYEWYLVETGARFLLWNEPVPEELFPLADAPFVVTPNKSFPSVVYLRNRPGRQWKAWRRKLHEARDSLRKEPEERLERLRARSERQIRRYGQQLEEPLQRVRRVLMVWQAERDTEQTPEERQATEARFKRLWNGFQQGARPDVIERWLRGLPACPVSPFQVEGVRYYVARRERVLKDLIPVHRKWWACEALLDVSRPDEEDGGPDNDEGEFHGNADHEPNWRFIVDRWNAKVNSGDYHSNEKIKEDLMAEYFEEFGKDISRSTVRRIYYKYKS